jgi:colanic acid biosynthesis glycosyl transferase WcaI
LKKKILVIEQNFYPEVAAAGQLMLDLCEDLVEAGYQVKVVTGNPKELFQKKIIISRRENYKGIEIVRLKNTELNKYNMIGRVINYVTFHLSISFYIIFSESPDLVLVLSNPPFISFHGLILKIFKKCKVIYNIQDLFPDIAIELGQLRNKTFIFILKTLSRYIIRKMDKIVVVGEYMERKIREEVLKNMEANHIVTIHNWADGEDLKVIDKKCNYLEREWGLEGKFVILYSGNMGYLHEFDTIIFAAEDIQNKEYKDVVFLFIGEGIKKDYIRKKAEEKGLNNILFFSYQPRDRLNFSLGLANISLVTLEKGFEGMVVPSKIYGILASGRPVIGVVGGESELTEIIREGKCGKFVKIGDYMTLSRVIIEYYKNPQKCINEGMSGRKYFEKNYDRKIATKKYIKVIEETLKI